MKQSYLNRIIGSPNTHRVIQNPLTGEKRVTTIESGTYNRRESLWFVIYHGTYHQCHNYLSVNK